MSLFSLYSAWYLCFAIYFLSLYDGELLLLHFMALWLKIEKSCFKKRARWFPDLGLKIGGGNWGCMWHNRGACVKAKQSCEALDGVRAKEKELDGFAPDGRWQ